jgi:putative endonuclease
VIARHLADGSWAEQHACRHLEREGLTLVEQNFSTRFGEIDLVMRDASTLVFVEVRLRRDVRYGHPAETINRAKQMRLRRTAEVYLRGRAGGGYPDCRFDVVAIIGDRHQAEVEWIRNAFH